MRTRPRPVIVIAASLAVAALLAACSKEQPAPPQLSSSETPAAAAPTVSATPPPLPPAPPPMSDRDQIVAALQAVADAYNTRNWDAYLELQCPAVRAKYTGPFLDTLKLGRDKQGLSSFKVIDVTIDGNEAKVKVDASNEVLGTQPITMPMERSDGWKLCPPTGAA